MIEMEHYIKNQFIELIPKIMEVCTEGVNREDEDNYGGHGEMAYSFALEFSLYLILHFLMKIHDDVEREDRLLKYRKLAKELLKEWEPFLPKKRESLN